jgi:UDP-2-acetamido-3-amino-2,3-dideoxy-glucuronate N-acetyltransferase
MSKASTRCVDSGSVSDKHFVHESSIVDEPCEIGEGTKVWHFCHIMKHAKIGRNCVLGQNVFVASGVVVGDNVKIQNNVSLYAGVVLEDDVFCGPGMVFTNVMTPRSHVCRKQEYQKTLVRKGATIGANATLVCGITVGPYALIGAGAVVAKDVPDYALITGVPGRIRGWVCQCGIKLALHRAVRFREERGDCRDCGKRYTKKGDLVKRVMEKDEILKPATRQSARPIVT